VDTVFDVFPETPYTFLQLGQGGILGNTILSETDAYGVLKLRTGTTSNLNREAVQSDATLHIHPNEQFIPVISEGSVEALIGHGIRSSKNGITQEYRVIGYKEGYNFDTNILEFWLLTLKAESIAESEDDS
jgi:hypothetical protein